MLCPGAIARMFGPTIKPSTLPHGRLLQCAASRFSLRIASAHHLPVLSMDQNEQVERFIAMLLSTNESFNLTAIRDPAEARIRHVDDSLSLLPLLDACIAKQGAAISPTPGAVKPRLIDIGSGGGLPGMIIAIARPEWDVVLLDSLRKRCDFMAKAAEEVGVSNVSVEWRRAEEAGRDSALRERFDLAIARAVAELRVLSELCLPFVTCGGYWVAPKGSDPNDEVVAARNAITLLGGELIDVQSTASVTSDGSYRTAVIVRKSSPTPEKFPRRAGVPNKRPLN